MTAQGHPRAIYQRAIERGNLAVAETTLREFGRPSLSELLELTALIAQKDPGGHPGCHPMATALPGRAR